jgi:starch synthase (maltosyl-transferring)
MNMRKQEGTIVISDIEPRVDCGRYPSKGSVGRPIGVSAKIFRHGTDILSAEVVYRDSGRDWSSVPMQRSEEDLWHSVFTPERNDVYRFTVQAWVDRYATWARDLSKWHSSGEDISGDLKDGIKLLGDISSRAGKERDGFSNIISALGTLPAEDAVRLATDASTLTLVRRYQLRSEVTRFEPEMEIIVDRERAVFSSWYELFPRSQSPVPGRHGTFVDCEKSLDYVKSMGFDVLYLTPIHPIGKTSRRGKNGSVVAGESDPGSPWAIGSSEGGHKSINPLLGTMDDFRHLVRTAESKGMEIAMDIAFQCSPDHPYVREHPEWFYRRPDGTIRYAENPPKKYYDIYPLNFETRDREGLWMELRSIFEFWIDAGIRIFRVDNPHTKPFPFWKWVIGEIRKKRPDVIFLAEAFTRPDVMYELSKIGFTMSYTYFTWKNFNWEIEDYFSELSGREKSAFFRPMLFTNTPDILPFVLQKGGRPAFMLRALLAATLSPLWGIYSGFELCENSALEGREEYMDSEKYELKYRHADAPGSIREFISTLNRIRRENRALQELGNLEFYRTENPNLVCYSRISGDGKNALLMIVNVNPFERQAAHVNIPWERVGMKGRGKFYVTDLITGERYEWNEGTNYVELVPGIRPGHVLRVEI